MELIVGCRNKEELKALDHFLKRFKIIPVNEEISLEAIKLLWQYKLSHGLLIADSLIASTSIIYKTSFLTKNQKDYRYIKKLKLITY